MNQVQPKKTLRSHAAVLGLLVAIAPVFGAMALADAPRPAADQQAVHLGPTEPLTIRTKAGPVKFSVELARTESEQHQGLMYRRDMAADAGMLFLFKRDRYLAFWMKNTYISLDMIFIKSDGTIVAIVPRTTPMSVDHISPDVRAAAVLEVNAGTAEANGIAVGDRVASAAFPDHPIADQMSTDQRAKDQRDPNP